MKKILLLIHIFIFFVPLPFTAELYAANVSIESMQDSINTCIEKQDYAAALDWGNKALKETEKRYGQINQVYVNSLHSVMEIFFIAGKFDNAIDSCKRALEIIHQLNGDTSAEYAAALSELAFLYEQSGDYDNAAEFCAEALAIRRKENLTDNSEFIENLSNLAYYNKILGNYGNSEFLYDECIKYGRKIFPDSSLDLAYYLYTYGRFLAGQGKFNGAGPYLSEASEMYRKYGSKEEMIDNLSYMAYYYNRINNFEKSGETYIQVLELSREYYDYKSDKVLTAINNLAMHYLDAGKYLAAEPLFKEAVEIAKAIYRDNPHERAIILNNVAYFYYKTGMYSQAENLYNEELRINRSILTNDDPALATSINNLAVFYLSMANYKKAEPLMKESLKLRKHIFPGDHPDLAQSISNMASMYMNMGYITKAEEYYRQSLEMKYRLYSGAHPAIALSLNELAACYEKLGQLGKADSLYALSLDMKREIYSGDHPDLALGIGNIAGFYDKNNKGGSPGSLYSESLSMFRRLYKNQDNPDLATAINNLANYYFKNDKFENARPLIKESLEMRKRLYNENHPDLARSYNLMAAFLDAAGQSDRAEGYFRKEINVYMKILHDYFSSLSEKEKKKFWETMNIYFEGFYSYAVRRYEDNPLIANDMFDKNIITRELLFNSSEKVKSAILNSNNTHLINMYNLWIAKRELLANIYKQPKISIEKSGIDLNELENEVNELEKYLTRMSGAFASEYNRRIINWHEIKESLKDDEAFVMLIRFRKKIKDRFTDTVNYAALIIDNETDNHPELILISNGNRLETELMNDYTELIAEQKINSISSGKLKEKMKELYDNYWGKIHRRIKDKDKIYLSPDGVFHKLNINTLVNPETGNYLIDDADIRIITDYNDFIKNDSSSSTGLKTGCLFGNPDFDYNIHSDTQTNNEQNREVSFSYNSELIDSLERSGIAPLPGTKIEIEKISQFMSDEDWDVNFYLGRDAVESKLKKVHRPTVLHIATHGKFLENIDRNDNFMNMESYNLTDHPLLRSMLFLAGAGVSLELSSKDITVFDTDDGIFTAYEAMNLDLENTELVTLSACETGLGEIRNGEGVYGLQKAFQSAGAKSLIMSLWTVSDKATQDLMSRFYRKWMGGKSKREAFRESQKEMKDKYPGFYYWGAFVMIGK